MATPTSQYSLSPRAYSSRPPVPEYPGQYLVKKVTTAGTFRLQHKLLDIANALIDQHIGWTRRTTASGRSTANTVLIATVDERDFIILW